VTLLTNCGSRQCPWVIQTDPVKKIKLSVIDLTPQSAELDQYDEDESACTPYFEVTEETGETIMICRPETSPEDVYTSMGHQIRLMLDVVDLAPVFTGDEILKKFLIQFQAVDQEDITITTPPTNPGVIQPPVPIPVPVPVPNPVPVPLPIPWPPPKYPRPCRRCGKIWSRKRRKWICRRCKG